MLVRAFLHVPALVLLLIVAPVGAQSRAKKTPPDGSSRVHNDGKIRSFSAATGTTQQAVLADVVLDNGVVGDGHLSVQLDEFGSFGDTNAWNDLFDPSADPIDGDLTELSQGVTFATTLRIFTDPASPVGGNRVLVTSIASLADGYNAGGFADTNGGATLSFEIVSPNSTANLPTSTDSVFRVFDVAQGIDLNFALTQTVSAAAPGPNGETAAKLEQTYVITNNGGGGLEFKINKNLDEDMPWGTQDNPQASYWLDDLVGMDAVELGRPQVFAQDRELVTAAMILRTREDMTADPRTTEFVYYAAKENLGNPGGGAATPECPDIGTGTFFTPMWNNFGVPDCYKNFVAGVGQNTAGASPQTSGDSYIGLQATVNLPAGDTYTITFVTFYGFRPVAPRFAAPDVQLVTSRTNPQTGCAEIAYTLTNKNEGGGNPPDPITTIYMDVEAGLGATNCLADVILPGDFTTVENCTGFDANGHAVLRMTGGLILPGESVQGGVIIDPNASIAKTNPATGVDVPAFSVVLSFAQDFPGLLDDFDPGCVAGPPTIGPRTNDGGRWSTPITAQAFLPIPAMTTPMKVLLATVLLVGGFVLVRRGRRASV